MKRRLEEAGVNGSDGERERKLSASGSAGLGLPAAAMSEDLKQMVAAMVAKEFVQSMSTATQSKSRFGNVRFEPSEQENVNAFLHQKLGKDNLTRRPGPRGTRLTYIESCKAIELANQAFGFNGWSCRVLECKEEYREQKTDRWSIGFSSLVRIELKDGTSHEDVGFGQADGQRDLGATIEQAKKASISDARKRALRLFGEYLGNSCYDREHIKEVHSSKAPASTNAPSPAAMAERQTTATATSASGMPTVLTATPNLPQNAPAPIQARPQSAQMAPESTFNQSAASTPARQNTGTTSTGPLPATNSAPTAANAIGSRISALHAADMSRKQAVTGMYGGPTAMAVGQQQKPYQAASQNHPPASASASPYGQGQFPHPPLHPIGKNAPPPTRMAGYQPQSAPIIKSETRVQPSAAYDMNDLSFSQFEYEPQR